LTRYGSIGLEAAVPFGHAKLRNWPIAYPNMRNLLSVKQPSKIASLSPKGPTGHVVLRIAAIPV
jgi:hypothetical protein